MILNTSGTIRLESTGIGAAGTITLTNAGPINLTTTGLITVGGPASVNIAPSMTTGNFVNIGGTGANSNSGLRCYTPITVNYGSNWSLPTTNQIGQLVSGLGTASDSTSTSLTKRYLTITPGVWILRGNVLYDNGSPWAHLSISSQDNVQQNVASSLTWSNTANFIMNVTRIVQQATGTAQNYHLVSATSSTVGINSVVFEALRIA
jgi:hypothetical protein